MAESRFVYKKASRDRFAGQPWAAVSIGRTFDFAHGKVRLSLRGLFAADGQAFDLDGGGGDCAAEFQVAGDFGNVEEKFF
jgi:hypothetical protein